MFKSLKLKCNEPLSNFAFSLELRQYTAVLTTTLGAGLALLGVATIVVDMLLLYVLPLRGVARGPGAARTAPATSATGMSNPR